MKQIYTVLHAVFLMVVAGFAADKRPNLLVLFTDDQRMDTLGCYNAACPIETPSLDRLAEQGRSRRIQSSVTTAS